MSVLFETSLGDLVVDLETDLCPITSENFLKLCKTFYYNFTSFFNVQKDFIAQTGDPTELGTGGESIYSKLKPSSSYPYYGKTYFPAELFPQNLKLLKHNTKGTLSMAVSDGRCASQFFFTLEDGLDYLDGKHVVFGRVVEGLETLDKINDALLDDNGRPLRDIRLRHVIVLDDPFPDPEELVIPPNSPIEPPSHLKGKILAVGDEEELDEDLDEEEAERRRRERDARAQALTLEMVGDLPFAEVAPPENILFVCKLNSITRSEDLELIFSRFGTILSCEVIKDGKTGDSLQYAFIEFDQREDAERAYFKMDGVLIDDRRIHVDFSQSVSKLHSDWVFKRTGRRTNPQTSSDRKPSHPSQPRSSHHSHGTNTNHKAHKNYEMTFESTERSKSDSRHYQSRHEGRGSGMRRDRDERGSRRSRSRSPQRRTSHHDRSDRRR
ncbi:uncharacterized protein MELLADRAFT_70923 [Melampsora larici-populina 98AG31]|uniref:Peptidyl-prolyl cis-trans isomerase n=1 Tax=Melampsora larici-populina (strain 98AG31 / pathotype 3-4-7) TaxID=747676 RepID=F4R9Q2_MELLP|nr:uncharacterized protein MELLADRAFT_70923 [Melampsora larici-populina 98AG31]EGG11110.1 hypothetical protein MELLADRAFT_70923 [Melampsora larici-populina 98AG31]